MIEPQRFLEDLDEKAFETLHVDEKYYAIRDLVEKLLYKSLEGLQEVPHEV